MIVAVEDGVDAGLVGERPFWGRFWELAALSPAERALLLFVMKDLCLGDLPIGGTISSASSTCCMRSWTIRRPRTSCCAVASTLRS